MKFLVWKNLNDALPVAPHAGAWIEIFKSSADASKQSVAPHAGAWIEISNGTRSSVSSEQVAPHAGAWIEISCHQADLQSGDVAPHAGAWIEISLFPVLFPSTYGRSPRGSVD